MLVDRRNKIVTYHFWIAFWVTTLLTGAVLGVIGWVFAKIAAPPPLEKFVSSVFEFELSKGWECEREGTEIFCHSGKPPYAAICILAMKYRGPDDNFDAYRNHLSTPREFEVTAGKLLRSEVKSIESRQIAGHSWVNSLHYQSEIPNYFTEYYATLTSHVAILVTFSVNEKDMGKYQKDLDTMISSLKVYQGGLL